MNTRLDGRTAVVTGAGSGIGAAAAVLFAQAGANLVLADLNEGPLGEVLQAAERCGVRAISAVTNVAKAAEVRALFALAQQTFGRIDVLLNAAGTLFHGTALETDDATWERLIAVNLTGTFLCCREVLPAMLARGKGAIVNISSTTGGHDACANAAAYVASKGGVTMLTKALAVDHARQGVRVNALCPGPTDTPMLRRMLTPEQLDAFAASFPMGRLGRAEELAQAALFLASDASSFMTGSLLTADGGQTAQV